ncbi:ECF-type sigma factor [Enterococcus timonensis]|uniref:ECF-type sigma factor n=1 Tax=Enterococcus timonensis TaxID=1852364 RepID=UPI0008DA4AE2|nr:ECF-type sigma factor [Enterococcus timonensis]
MHNWIQDVRQGDEDALVDNYRKYHPLVLRLRSSYYLRFFDLDDWLQEGLILFHRSVMNYDDSLGVTFGLYFKKNFTRHIISILRKEQALKRRGDLQAASFEAELELGEMNMKMNNYQNINDYADMLHVAEQVRSFYQVLTPIEMKIADFHFSGFDAPELALLFGITDDEAKKKIKSIHKKFRQRLRGDI